MKRDIIPITIIAVLALVIAIGGVGIGLAWRTDYLDRWLPQIVKEWFGKEDPTTRDWKTYRNEVLGFEMKYPKDWEVLDHGSAQMNFSNSLTKDSTKFSCNFNVGRLLNQENFENSKETYISESYIQSTQTIAGVSAIKFTHPETLDFAFLLENRKEDRFFSFWQTSEKFREDEWISVEVSECSDIYNKMLATFKLFDPTLTCIDTDGGYKPSDSGVVEGYLGEDDFGDLYGLSDFCSTDPRGIQVGSCSGAHCFQREAVCYQSETAGFIGTVQASLPCPKGCQSGVCADWKEPSITITSPNGGETWKVGKKHRISWSSVGVDAVRISYSSGGGDKTIATLNDNPGYYDWTIPFDFDLSWALHKIHVEAHNIKYLPSGADHFVTPEDGSDDKFTITLDKCIDTDGGRDYYVKGYARGYQDESHQKILGDWDSCSTCFDDGTCAGVQPTGEGVLEGTCGENDVRVVPYYKCPNGCKDGACVK